MLLAIPAAAARLQRQLEILGRERRRDAAELLHPIFVRDAGQAVEVVEPLAMLAARAGGAALAPHQTRERGERRGFARRQLADEIDQQALALAATNEVDPRIGLVQPEAHLAFAVRAAEHE